MAAMEARVNFKQILEYSEDQLLECFTQRKNVPSTKSHMVTREYTCYLLPDRACCFTVSGEYAKRKMRLHLKKHILTLKKRGELSGNLPVHVLVFIC